MSLIALLIFSVFDVGYCGGGPLIYEMDFKSDTFYEGSDRGVLNTFHLYLPVTTPQPGIHKYKALGRGKTSYINSLSDLRPRNYPIKVWYELWLSDNPDRLLVKNDNKPYFKISKCALTP